MDHSEAILDSWNANAGNWIATVDNNEIESRNLVTNNAIVNTVLDYPINSIIDIGCGEGWLTRALFTKGKKVTGVDAIEALIANARTKAGGPNYEVASFEQVVKDSFSRKYTFDAAVINFALLDQQHTEILLKGIHRLLKPAGCVFIQTLHPLVMAENGNYSPGWKEGSWNGLKRDFEKSYQWYFRTLQDWIAVFRESNLLLREVKEPLHPQTQKPVSIIFVLETR